MMELRGYGVLILIVSMYFSEDVGDMFIMVVCFSDCKVMVKSNRII